MSLIAVGLNHTTAPLELREKLVVPSDDVTHQLEFLARSAGLREVMLLSTCNRVEVYGVPQDNEPQRIIDALAKIRGERASQFEGHYFARGGVGAVRHIFRVAASLESMVVGEPQILGQVKEAYQIARERGTLGTTLDRCMTMAFKGAKRVRTETDLARGGASISSVAVDLAASIFGDLNGAKVAVIGAGEMARHAAEHLRSAGVSKILVVNRSEERGRSLAEKVEGEYLPWDKLEHALASVDIVITSTGSIAPIITPELMKKTMRKRRGRTIFLVDIAVPRDVAPGVGNLEQVFAYDIDDLQRIVADNMAQRGAHTDAAQQVLEQEVTAFLNWQRSRDLAPLIGKLQSFGQEVGQTELQRHAAKLGALDESQRQAMESLVHGVIQKMLHRPMTRLRSSSEEAAPDQPDLAEAMRQLFDLGKDEEPKDD